MEKCARLTGCFVVVVLLLFLYGLCVSLMVSVLYSGLNRPGLCTGQRGSFAWCSWAGCFILTVPLSTHGRCINGYQ